MPSERDGLSPLYGAAIHSINRRLLLAGLIALPVAAHAQKRKKTKEPRITSLHWEGTSRIFVGNSHISIGVSTTIQPFGRVRSDSWLVSEGPGKRRTLVIEDNQGWTEGGGGLNRITLPAQQVLHERQQYAAYAYMLEGPPEPPKPKKRKKNEPEPPPVYDPTITRQVSQDGFPPATLTFLNGKLTYVDMVVDPPQSGPRINERFTLSGEIVSNNIRWPRQITITQDGRAYQELTLQAFHVTIE